MTRHIRPIRIEGNLAYITLTKGRVTVIDASDVGIANGNWHLGGTGYACQMSGRAVLLLHRVIVVCPAGSEVDHIDGDKLNNRRCNLRIATREENQRNVGLTKANKSGFKGASWNAAKGKWVSQICHRYKVKTIGAFDTVEEAHAAYCKESARLHGDFGRVS